MKIVSSFTQPNVFPVWVSPVEHRSRCYEEYLNIFVHIMKAKGVKTKINLIDYY